MPIRLAQAADIPRIVELGSESLKEGPYSGIIEDVPEQSKQFAEWVINNGNVVLGEEDGEIVGLLAFITTAHHFSGQPYSAELMWYVSPEYRKGGLGLKLLWEAEKQAKQRGAQSMVFTAPNEDVASLYQRFGYRKLEVTFQKQL